VLNLASFAVFGSSKWLFAFKTWFMNCDSSNFITNKKRLYTIDKKVIENIETRISIPVNREYYWLKLTRYINAFL